MKFILHCFFLIIFLSKNVNSLDFEEIKSDKGINFWFVEDKSVPIISLSFSFKGGAFNDPLGKEGVSNLMTSLLDEGTNKMTSIDFKQSMKLNGIKLFFSTQKDKVEGTFQVISSNKKKGFQLLFDAINEPSFEKNEIVKVKNQIQSSIKIDESNISNLASMKFNENFYINHNFSRINKGTIKSLEKIKRQDIKKIHKRNFSLSNLTLGVSGDISKNEIGKYIDLVFGELPRFNENEDIPKFESLNIGEKLFDIETPQTAVVFGQHGLERNNEDFFAARIVNYILGGGSFQSRLYKNVREKKGLVYSIYSYLLPYRNDGIIIGGFQTRNESVNKVIKMIRDEWKRIKNKGISKEELDNAKAYFKGSFSRNYTSTMSIANLLEIVQYYRLGTDYFKKRDEIIDKLDLDYVNKVASKTFDEKKLFFMIVGKPN